MVRPKFFLAAVALFGSGLVIAGGSHYVRVLDEAKRAQAWVAAPGEPLVLAGYPDAATDRNLDVCVNIGYLIDARGRTSKFVELRSWSSASGEKLPSAESIEPYVQIAAAVLSRRSYAPVGKPHPTFTSETFSFAGSSKLAPEAIAGNCRIEDLQAVVNGQWDQRIQKPILSNRYETRMKRGHQCEWFSLYCTLISGD